jgi:hypothetical protein
LSLSRNSLHYIQPLCSEEEDTRSCSMKLESSPYPDALIDTVTCLVTRYGGWIGNWIYWTLKNRNYK